MQSTNSDDIKLRYRQYSNKLGYMYHDSIPIVASQQSRLLFNISGGVRYQEELLEQKRAEEEQVSSIQKCVRTDSIDSVGISGRHHIYFEMLGHFMFYLHNEKETKENFIEFSYNFLLNELGLERNRIFATVHPNDDVTLSVWNKLGNKNIITNERNIFISPYAEKSALRTEILWQRTDESLVELWNLVFTQFNSSKLFENPSLMVGADSGASLERIVSAYENKDNNYENSMWFDYVKYISELGDKGEIHIFRKTADLMNAIVNLIQEGLIPGNKVQPYMLRKMMRNTFDLCDDLGIEVNQLLGYITSDEKIQLIFDDEKSRYIKSISNGLKQAKKMINKFGIENIDFNYLRSTCGLSDRYINILLSQSSKVKIK